MYNDENYKKRIFVLEIRSMITTMSYNAFLRNLSSLSFGLLSSSAIFFDTQSTAFLWPWNLYLRGHNKKWRAIAFNFQEAKGNIWLSCVNLRLIIVWKVSFKTRRWLKKDYMHKKHKLLILLSWNKFYSFHPLPEIGRGKAIKLNELVFYVWFIWSILS